MEKTNEEIILSYEKNKFNNEKKRDYFVEKLYSQIPELKAIQQEMNQLTLKNLIEITQNYSDKKYREEKRLELKEKINELEMKKEEILKKYKISKKELEIKYDCDKCKDTGFVKNNGKTQKCTCFMQKQIDEKYKTSKLNQLNKKTLENFEIEYFKDENNEKGINKRDQAKKVLEQLYKYVKDFENIQNESKPGIMMIGETGTGKTHLLEAVGNAILEKNHTVLFETASNLFNKLLEYKFNDIAKYNELVSYLNEVELLIIDDLGTEALNEYKKEEVYMLINSRLYYNKPILISTNLPLAGLNKKYGDRIFSRILEKIRPFGIYGEDIRVKKAKEGMKK